MFTISVEYDEDDQYDVAAIAAMAVQFEECISRVGLALDNLEEEDIA